MIRISRYPLLIRLSSVRDLEYLAFDSISVLTEIGLFTLPQLCQLRLVREMYQSSAPWTVLPVLCWSGQISIYDSAIYKHIKLNSQDQGWFCTDV